MNARPKLLAPPITSPVDFISGPRIVSTPGKRTNGNTGLLTNTPAGSRSSTSPSCARVLPAITRAAICASATPVAFERYGTVRDARGLTSSTYTSSSLMAYCTFISPIDLERRCDAPRVVANRREVLLAHARGRDDAGAVAGVDAGLLDVLHHAADDDRAGVVRDAVDVELLGSLEKAVDQDRPVVRHVDGRRHVSIERADVVHNRHVAAAEHVRRPHHDRESDLGRRVARFVPRGRGSAGRLRNPEVPQQLREALAILRQINRIGRGAENLDARFLQRQRQLERRLTAELHDARDVGMTLRARAR